MSVDLGVVVKNDVMMSDLLELTSSTLKDILSLSWTPELSFCKLDKGERICVRDGNVGVVGVAYLVSVCGVDSEVMVGAIDEPSLNGENVDNLVHVYINVGIIRNVVDVALAAALAISIASMEGSTIYDDACFWSLDIEQEYVDFVSKIKAVKKHTDIVEAAEELYERLPAREG
jgi:hypothetical protein